MSESRCGESRGFFSYRSYSSESRSIGESRCAPIISSYSAPAESRASSESCLPMVRSRGPESTSSKLPTSKQSIAQTQDLSGVPTKYNNFEDIDTLIEELKVTIPILEQLQNRGKKYSESLKRRLAQIEQLKQIREDRIISEIERESDEFEEKINEVKKLTLKPKKQSSSYGGWGYDASESHDDGESRW